MIERLFTVSLKNLRHNLTLPLFSALIITALVPIIAGISSLDSKAAAMPIETLLSVTGTALLTPVFSPESDSGIYGTAASRKMGLTAVYIVRIIICLLLEAAIVGGFTYLMYLLECKVTYLHFVGGLISAVFLGSIGMLFSGISGNIIVGYMTSTMFFAANIAAGKKLGFLWLSSMTAGSFSEKKILLPLSVILITLAVFFARIRDSKR